MAEPFLHPANAENSPSEAAITVRRDDVCRTFKLFANWFTKRVSMWSNVPMTDTVCAGVISLSVSKKASIYTSAQKCALFLHNWIAVYNNLMVNGLNESNYDELGNQTASFRAAVDFFFSPYVMLTSIILTLYSVVISLIYSLGTVGKPNASFFFVSNVFGQMFYCWACYIYTGKVFCFAIVGSRSLQPQKSVFRKLLTLGYYMLHSTHTGRALDAVIEDTDWKPNVMEARDLMVNVPGASSLNSGGSIDTGGLNTPFDSPHPDRDMESLSGMSSNGSNPIFSTTPQLLDLLGSKTEPIEGSFYEMLNAMTKYIVYADSDGGAKVPTTKRVFRLNNSSHNVLRFCLIVTFLYNFVLEWGVILFEEIISIEKSRVVNVSFILGLFGVIDALQGALMGGAFSTIFTGMLISGDIFNEMCTRWLIRFSTLRKVTSLEGLGCCGESKTATTATAGDNADERAIRVLYRLSPIIRKDAFERYVILFNQFL